MKTLFFILFLSAGCLNVFSQSGSNPSFTAGKVIYQETVKIDLSGKDLPDEVLAMLPKENKIQKQLTFTPQASIYTTFKKESTDPVDADGGMVVVMKMENNDIIYRDLVNHKQIQQVEFMTRKFLIDGKDKEIQWKLTGKQKTILNYTCMEAETTKDNKKVTAWFTPQIPVPTGPASYGDLPGLILSIDIDNGTIHTEAISVTPETSVDPIVAPNEGKKVTAEQFKQIREKKMEEQKKAGTRVFRLN